jgi:hypothetical protein
VAAEVPGALLQWSGRPPPPSAPSCTGPPSSYGDVATASASVKIPCAMPFLPSTSVLGMWDGGDEAESCWSCGAPRYQQQQQAVLNRDLTVCVAKTECSGFSPGKVMTRGALLRRHKMGAPVRLSGWFGSFYRARFLHPPPPPSLSPSTPPPMRFKGGMRTTLSHAFHENFQKILPVYERFDLGILFHDLQSPFSFSASAV